VAVDFPSAARTKAPYIAVAAATFLLPTVVVGLLVYSRPELILSVVSSETAASFEEMYSASARSIGRARTATTDWMMFGFYIRHNVGVSFQCFAGGLFAGLGSLFFLAYVRDPGTHFIPIQMKLGLGDGLSEYIQHTGSALFAIPPGVAQGGYVGEALFS